MPEAELHWSGTPHDPPPGPFDAALAMQLVEHIANPVAVLRAAGAVAPIVVVTVWGRERSATRASSARRSPLVATTPPRPGPRPVTEPDRLRKLVGLAGWT